MKTERERGEKGREHMYHRPQPIPHYKDFFIHVSVLFLIFIKNLLFIEFERTKILKVRSKLPFLIKCKTKMKKIGTLNNSPGIIEGDNFPTNDKIYKVKVSCKFIGLVY